MNKPPNNEEARAARRFVLINMVRFGSVIALGLGLMIVRDVISAPYWLGVVVTFVGAGAFFFIPPMLAKRWKSSDRDAQ